MPDSERFTGLMGAVPIPPPHPRIPTAEQIAATGAALPAGAHRLSDEQQRAWFGGVVFEGPVAWDDRAGVFVSLGVKLTPAAVAALAQGGR